MRLRVKASVIKLHKASFLILLATLAVCISLLLSPAFSASSSPCGSCHSGYTQYLDILEGNSGNVLPSSLDVGKTTTVTVVIENNVNTAAFTSMSSVSLTLSSQNGHFTVSTPTFSVGNLPKGTAMASWQITGVSAGSDALVIKAAGRNTHQSLSFSDSYSPSPALTVQATTPIPTPTPTPTPTPPPTPTPTISPAPTPSPTPTSAPTPTPTASPTPLPTPVPTSTATPIATSSPSPTPTPTTPFTSTQKPTSIPPLTSLPSPTLTPSPTSAPEPDTPTNLDKDATEPSLTAIVMLHLPFLLPTALITAILYKRRLRQAQTRGERSVPR